MTELEMRMPMPLAKGVPDSETPGWVGLLAMDVTDPEMTVYRCTVVSDGVYTWVRFAAGGGSGGIAQETDPTVPAWAKQKDPPFLTDENLQAAVDDALSQAKESGEFDGAPADVWTLAGTLTGAVGGTAEVRLYHNGVLSTERKYLYVMVSSGGTDWRVHGTSTGGITGTKSWTYGGTENGIAWRCEAYTDSTKSELLAACFLASGANGADYTLTDSDKSEIAKEAAELVDVTGKADAASVPNSGVVSDGNELVMQRTDGDSVVDLFRVPLPASGGGAGDNWELINTITVDNDETGQVVFSADSAGNPFALKKIYLRVVGFTGGYTYPVLRVNNLNWMQQFRLGSIVSNDTATTEQDPCWAVLDVSGPLYRLDAHGNNTTTPLNIDVRLPGILTVNGGVQSVIENITSLVFMRGTGSALDNGMKAELYGVRA